MGQAKQRGTFEQRQAEAVAREAEERIQRLERARLTPIRRPDPALASLISIIATGVPAWRFRR
jgi:hypothetical protein